MDRLNGAWARLRDLLFRRSAEREMDEELRHHLEMEVEHNLRQGMTPAEAQRQAAIAFGGVEKHREALRDGRRLPLVEDLLADLRYAARSLGRHPGFAAVAIATLGVGIGAGTAMFTVVNGVLLRDLPVVAQDELVLLRKPMPAGPIDHGPVPGRELAAFEERSRTFEDLAGFAFTGVADQVLRDAGEPFTAAGIGVTGDFLPLLGVVPHLGRSLTEADDVAGAAPAMVIGHAFWRRHFGGDPAAVGHALEREGKQFTIVGVLPRGFEFPQGADFWIPIGAASPRPGAVPLEVVGRLRDGATREASGRDYAAFLREEYGALPVADVERAFVVSLEEEVTGDVDQTLRVATVAVVLLHLTACVNVANLLLVRGAARVHELAIRRALGGGKGRLARQLLTESGLLAVMGGLAGVGLAVAGVRALLVTAPPGLPGRDSIEVDSEVLLFAVALTVATALLAGLLPALIASRGNLEGWLRRGIGTASAGRSARTLRHGLVVGQVALSVLVLASAGIVTRSLLSLQRVDLGYDAERLHVLETNRPLTEEALERIRAIPGVANAAALLQRPFDDIASTLFYTAEGQTPEEQAANSLVTLEVVGPEYFPTLGLPVRRGRPFAEHDRQGALPVAIVSEAVARRTWPGEDPIGKRIKRGAPGSQAEWLTVVGVVGETRYRDLATLQPSIYVPIRQASSPRGLAVRSDLDSSTLIPQIRGILTRLEPEWAVVVGGPLRQFLARPLARPRFTVILMTTFAGTTLLLSAVGLFAVQATSVRQRTREIGIRLAVGASGAQVRRLVLLQGLRLALGGCAIGIVVALFGTRLLRGLLFETSPTDPVTFVAVVGLVLGVVVLACLPPARRAGRIDPVVALRAE